MRAVLRSVLGRRKTLAITAVFIAFLLALIAWSLGPSTLQRLKSATTELRDSSGDERLDSVLAEIELRLAVEIAKLGPRP